MNTLSYFLRRPLKAVASSYAGIGLICLCTLDSFAIYEIAIAFIVLPGVLILAGYGSVLIVSAMVLLVFLVIENRLRRHNRIKHNSSN